jgi:hypothetical protein
MPHTVVSEIPSWGSVTPSPVRPVPVARGAKKNVSTQTYAALVEDFERSEDTAVEVVYDHTLQVPHTLWTSLNAARGRDYLHIECKIRGDRVFLCKRGVPGVVLLQGRLGRSMLRMTALTVERDRLVREYESLGALTETVGDIVLAAQHQIEGAMKRETQKQTRIQESIAALNAAGEK